MSEILLNLDTLEIEPKFGPDTNTFYVITDLANQYLMYLIQEKNEEEGLNLALTEGIILSDTEPQTVENMCALLSMKYQDLIDKDGVEGIYTVMNIAPSLNKPAHQNWLFYDINNQRILRFEPNGKEWDTRASAQVYKLPALMDCIAGSLGVEWTYSENVPINTFNGCRATSTILALMNLLDIDLDILADKEEPYLRTLALQVSDAIKACPMKPIPRKRRRTTELSTLAQPTKKPKTRVEEIPNPKIIQGDRTVEVFDPTTKTNAELRKYLLDNKVSFPFRLSRLGLIGKVMEFQDPLIFVK
jgi:hypothetical protein